MLFDVPWAGTAEGSRRYEADSPGNWNAVADPHTGDDRVSRRDCDGL